MKRCVTRLWHDQQGQDTIEYALAVGMVALAAVATMPPLTNTVTAVFSKITSFIDKVVL